jgi:lactam utilization protein B
MATEGRVETVDGDEVAVEVRSLCVHGDTPGAVELAKAVRAALDEAGVTLEAFA